jgi:VWFA-related protein
MRQSAIAVVSAVLVAGALAAAQSGQRPVFRGGVTLVTVDATVLDHDGQPVPGLTAADFEVRFNGKVQAVRTIDYEQRAAGASAVTAQGLSAGSRQVSNASPKAEPRVFVVLVDDLSYAPGQGKVLFAAASRFVAGLPAGDLVGLATTSGPGAVNPTTDRAAVEAGLQRVVGTFADPRQFGSHDYNVGITESLDIAQGDSTALKNVIARECFHGSTTQTTATGDIMTAMSSSDCASAVYAQALRTAAFTRVTTGRQLAACLATINALAQAPGVKHLVVLSNGLGLPRDATGVDPVARAAAAARVQVNVIVAEPNPDIRDTGALDPANPTNGGATQLRRDDDRALMNGLQTVADMSGGTFFEVIGAADPFFQRVAAASSAVYRLGIAPPADAPPGTDYALSVRVHRSGLTVHANRHAVVPGPAAVVPPDEQLRQSIATGAAHYAVPIALGTALRRDPASQQVQIAVNVQMPASEKGPLTAMFGLVDAAGGVKSGQRILQPPEGGGDYFVSFAVPVSAGTYRVRFAVADADGKVGSVESNVIAQLPKVGPFAASDLLTSWMDDNDQTRFLAVEALPPTAVAVNVSLELYPPSGAPSPDVNVHYTVTLAGQSAPVMERDAAIETADGAIHADTRFPADVLAPGLYTIRAAVLVGGKQVGSTTTTFRKSRRDVWRGRVPPARGRARPR